MSNFSKETLEKIDPIEPDFNSRSFDGTDAEPVKVNRPPPFSIRFTERERAILRRECRGKPWADYIRERVFGTEFTATQRGRRDVFSELAIARALGKLGESRLAANMNQIARAANCGLLPASPELAEELQGAVEDIALMREALVAALGIRVDY